MSDYDAAFDAAIGKSAPADNPYDAAFSASFSAPAKQTPIESVRQPATLGQRTGALINGVNSGFWTRIPGLPGDTAANVVDLLKAGTGYLASQFNGGSVPKALELTPRENTPLTSDWIKAKLRQAGAGPAFDNPRPDDAASRILYGTGEAAGSSVFGRSPAELAVNTSMGAASGAAGNTVAEVTDNPALAITASMLPQTAAIAATQGTRYAVRGGEQGRRQMEQRVQDLKNAGITTPTVGLASGNRMIEGTENLLANTPGAIDNMARARANILGQIANKASQTADLASTRRGELESGKTLQAGAKSFKDDFKARQAGLYGRLDGLVDPLAPVDVGNILSSFSDVNATIPGAPELSKQFQNSRLVALENAFRNDVAGAPASVMVYPQPPKAGGGLWNAPVSQPPALVQIPAQPPTNSMPFKAVQKFRTLVGNEIADSTIASPVPRSKWNPMYAAASEDIRGAAANAGDDATRAFNRANDFTRAGVERLNAIDPIIDRKTPEATFSALENTLKNGPTEYRAIKKSVPESARGDFAGTVIDNLGKARAGAQNADGTVWSPQTFLTEWNKLDQKAKSEAFSGFKNSAEVAKSMDRIAKASEMLRDGSKMWANPSGTAANLTARAGFGGVAMGVLMAPFYPAAGAAAAAGASSMLAANVASRLFTNPKFVTWLSKATTMPEGRVQSHAQRLVATANMSGDKQFKEDVGAYFRALYGTDNGDEDGNEGSNDK